MWHIARHKVCFLDEFHVRQYRKLFGADDIDPRREFVPSPSLIVKKLQQTAKEFTILGRTSLSFMSLRLQIGMVLTGRKGLVSKTWECEKLN